MNENEIKQNIKNSMDNITESIDVSTQVKLNEARHAALNQTNKKRLAPMLSLLGMACAVILVVSLLWNQAPIENIATQGEISWLEDLDLLATEEDPEFYQDLEFLSWLEENQLIETDI